MKRGVFIAKPSTEEYPIPEVRIIITGISMGASTAMLAAGRELPSQVIGVLADCGFTSARDIIQVVIRKMKLPPKLA